MRDDVYELAVIGGGVAGAAAALRAGQYAIATVWLTGDAATARRSRAQWVVNIDNMLGIHDGIVRKKIARELSAPEHAAARALVLAGHAHISTRDLVANARERLQQEGYDCVRVIDQAVGGARRQGEAFVLEHEGGPSRARRLILATGVMDRQPRIAKEKGGEILDDPRWIYPYANRESILYCIRCEGHLTRNERVAVIGHGPAAAELAAMLHERYGSAGFVLTNGEPPGWDEDAGRLLERYGIEVATGRITDAVGPKGRLGALVVQGRAAPVEVRFALVALGLQRVYNDLARELGARLADPDRPIGERHVLVDAVGQTSVRDLYAVGDMATHADGPIMKQVYTAQEYAVRAVDSVDRRIRRERRRSR